MKRQDWVALLMGLLPTLLSIGYSEYTRRAALERGDVAEKHLRIDPITTIDPLGTLSLYGGGHAKAALTLDDKPVSNLRIASTALRNTGAAAIRKEDFSESIRLTVNAPWKILLVERPNYFPDEFFFNWHPDPDGSFVADPALINAGDATSLSIYLTSPSNTTNPPEPELKFHARIVNMRDFEYLPQYDLGHPFEVEPFVFLDGWAIAIVLLLAVLNQMAYMVLLSGDQLFDRGGWIGRAAFIGTMLVSVCAAEITTTSYIRVQPLFAQLGMGDWWLNWAVLALHVGLLAGLFLRRRLRLRRSTP